MSYVKMCRVCLSTDVKLFTSDQYHLQQFYEEIMMKKIIDKVGIPRYFCFMCAAMLYKYHKFKEKCQTAENYLNELHEKGPIPPKLKQDKQYVSDINIMIANDNVKTYTFKSRSYKKRTINKTKIETVKINSNIKDIRTDFDNEITIVDVLQENNDKIDTDNKNDEIASVLSIDNTLEDNDDRVSDDEFLSNIKTETTQITIDKPEKLTKKRTIVEKKEKVKRKNKRVEKIVKERKQRKFETYSSRDNILDPQHWFKINLSEVEAIEEYKAKANDPKYKAAVYKCTDCFKGFSREDIMLRHRKLRHDEAVGPIVCRFCSTRFKLKCKLSRHINQHYSKFKCLRCDLVCVLENTAQLHNEYHNGVTRTCKHCGQEFRHLSSYYTHLRTHRSEHVCTICGASFVSVVGLNMHKQSMHVTDINGPQESIHCSQCDIMFETKRAYDEHFVHSAMHSEGVEDLVDEKPTASLPKHRRKTFRRNPRIPSHCALCNKTFGTQTAYFNHYSSEHKDLPHPSRDGQSKVVCEVCGQSLAFNSMKSHLNTHTREKIFTCSICGMQLVTKASLKRHQLTHTGEKPFECTLCDKRFTQKGSMQLHYRTYHLKEPYPKRNRRKKADNDELGLFDDYRNEDDSESNSKIDRWRH